MIDKEHVVHIAKLARLRLSEDEVNGMVNSLSSILDYIEELNKADTTGVESTCFVIPAHDPLRDDIAQESLSPEEALRNGPSVKKQHFAIPKVIE